MKKILLGFILGFIGAIWFESYIPKEYSLEAFNWCVKDNKLGYYFRSQAKAKLSQKEDYIFIHDPTARINSYEIALGKLFNQLTILNSIEDKDCEVKE